MTSSEIREPVRVLVFSASMRGGSLNTPGLPNWAAGYRQGERWNGRPGSMTDFDAPSFDADYESGRYGNGPTSIRAQKP